MSETPQTSVPPAGAVAPSASEAAAPCTDCTASEPGFREVFLREAGLRAFQSPLTLRDPCGRSKHPNLVFAQSSEDVGYLARGPFNVHQRFTVSREQGKLFCEATGDDNPIHREGDIVPGAFTAAKLLLAIEVIFPDLELARFSMKFTAMAHYGRVLFTQLRGEPSEKGAIFTAVTTQEGETVAEMEVEAHRREAEQEPPPLARRKVNVEELKRVRTFIHSLGMTAHSYFAYFTRAALARDTKAFYYPKAFLASLPTGEMVRQLRGEGGLLNKLTLEFGGARIPISTDAPLVDVEAPKKRRSTFNKILTAIRDGFGTYVRGTALVLSGDAAAKLQEKALPAPGAAAAEASEPKPATA